MTSGGNYPPGPYTGSHGYPPEDNDSSERRRRDAYGPDPSERDVEPSPSVAGSPDSSSPAASPAVARAAISMPGLRVEPPADGQPGSAAAAAGQVYGRPSPTTYGRPASPVPVGDPDPPVRQAADEHGFGGPGQPRGYGQAQRPQSIEPEDEPYDSGARRGVRSAAPGQLDDQHPDSWGDEREDPPSWQQQNNNAPSWQQNNNAPSWQQGDDRGPTPGPAERTPGLYGHSAATSAPAPQPLYGGAPPVSPSDASSNGPVGQPDSADSADSADAASNGHPGVDGPSASAFGPGVYGAGVYGAAAYGTPRDLGSHDDSMSSPDGVDAAPGRNGFVYPGEARHGLDRPAAPASSQDAPGDHNNQVNGGQVYDKQINDQQVNDQQVNDQQVNDQQVNDQQVNGYQLNGGRVNGDPANATATPDSPSARSGGGVYGTPRVYGSPRPTPADDGAGDSPNRFDDRREPNHLADRPGSIGDLPPRTFGDVPGRAVADMPRRSAPGDGIGRPGDAVDRARFDEAMPPTALGRPVPAWPDPPRPEFNAVAPEAPTSPSGTRLGQTYGSSRPPIDWNVPEQHNRARFDSPFAPGEGVRIPTGTASFTSPGFDGGDRGGDGGGVAPADDIRPAPEPRRWVRKAGIAAIVVIVIGLAAGALYYTSRPNAPSYQIGSCVQHSGEKVNGSTCTAPNSFKIISKVSDVSACPKANDPYLYLGNDKSTVYCLAPN